MGVREGGFGFIVCCWCLFFCFRLFWGLSSIVIGSGGFVMVSL